MKSNRGISLRGKGFYRESKFYIGMARHYRNNKLLCIDKYSSPEYYIYLARQSNMYARIADRKENVSNIQ